MSAKRKILVFALPIILGMTLAPLACAGGAYSTVAGGLGNTANGDYSSVGGGYENSANYNFSSIGGGVQNSANAYYSEIAGGFGNQTGGKYSSVGGGQENFAHGGVSTVAGGALNLTDGYGSIIAGGLQNYTSTTASSIGGGYQNQALGEGSTVSGGQFNLAVGRNAAVSGGLSNYAGGDFSWAGGLGSKVRNASESSTKGGDHGTFIWADDAGYPFSSTGPSQFLVRAAGGFALNGPPVAPANMTIAGDSVGADTPGTLFLHQGNNDAGTLLSSYGAAGKNDAWFAIGQYNGTFTSQPRLTLNGAGDLTVTANAYKPGGGSWAASSDQRLKKNVQSIEHPLDRLLALRGVTFEYKKQDSAMHPLGSFTGFIAQEVEPLFPRWIGHDPDGYLTVGPQGFEALTVEALRELKTQNEKRVADLEHDNSELRAQMIALKEGYDALHKEIAALASTQAAGSIAQAH